MSENTNEAKGLFETLEEKAPEYISQSNGKSFHDSLSTREEDTYEFMIQDMFLDHFFP